MAILSKWLEHTKNWLRWKLFGRHMHSYSIAGIIVHQMPEDIGVPVVGWMYQCWCGDRIISLTPTGIEQLQAGVSWEELIREHIW